MQARTAVLVGLLGVTLGWAVGTRVQPGTDDRAEGRASSGPRPLETAPPADAARLTEQLRLRLQRKPQAPRTARNPFVFGTRPSVVPSPRAGAPAAPANDAAAAEAIPAVVPPPASTLRLAGMASTAVDGRTEWTAMIYEGSSLLFVTLGDRLPGGLEVVDVQESSVTLRDASGADRTLRLP